MKRSRVISLLCALALITSGCKAQSITDDESGAAGEGTFQTVESSISDVQELTKQTQTSAADVTESTVPTEAETSEAETYPEPLQGYLAGSDNTVIAFEAPEGLVFVEESTDDSKYECYSYNNDYTIAVILTDYQYTLGQPQELLDYMGYPGDFYIRAEYFTETDADGSSFDMVMLDLYNDEEMQDYHSTGVCGIYPTEHGCLFFGFEMQTQDYCNTALKSLKSARIFECENAPSGTKIVNQSEVSPDFSITMPYEFNVEDFEQQYLDTGDKPDYCTILFAENEDLTLSAHCWRGEGAWQYALDSMDTEADDSPDYVGVMAYYKLNDGTYIYFQYEDGSIIFAGGYYKVSDTEFVLVTINLPYDYDLEEDYIFSLIGLELSEDSVLPQFDTNI